MKGLLILVALAAVVAVPFARPAAAQQPKPLKGYELYSWQDEKKGWQFAIVVGTNELKTEYKVKTAPTVYTGTDKLIDAFKQLPKGVTVSWSHNIKGFEYPVESDRRLIQDTAKAMEIDLRVPEK